MGCTVAYDAPSNTIFKNKTDTNEIQQAKYTFMLFKLLKIKIKRLAL